ncbi:sulfite exporter TauE/SafE family protein [Asticcacaulis sp. ZE23SCel15]|uniref:sulfite exporter TauE/SafE family protein n=1 Tax=Asticcacaulis sp. ZE23SCel15 TaxID=3059027 RepID=UPI00265F4C36|nr:sulfite exporter TauE/SafE family protein [Asticcacaulis sp. ZE23SCel15]WKL58850.1 sulfite exporter TauE/SafE family protein [Asticcacaulis sp. ZE23SCel15]
MDIYLPIAEMSVNVLTMIGLGVLVGFVSGLFGVGGGFLMAPVLVSLGIPPSVAVASQAGHVLATSTSSVMSYSQSDSVDYRMGAVMAAGGVVGAIIGVEIFRILRLLGQIDLVVSVAYLLVLGSIGGMMLNESLSAMLRRRKGESPPRPKVKRPVWIYGLPFKMRFPRSGLYISFIPPAAIGLLVGILSAMMGVGGGFLIVPAMIYILRMKASVVVGTSLFQIIITTLVTMILQAVRNHSVDMILALILLAGGVVGGQAGIRMANRFRADELRAIMAVIILMAGLQMGLSLFVPPQDPFVLVPTGQQ